MLISSLTDGFTQPAIICNLCCRSVTLHLTCFLWWDLITFNWRIILALYLFFLCHREWRRQRGRGTQPGRHGGCPVFRARQLDLIYFLSSSSLLPGESYKVDNKEDKEDLHTVIRENEGQLVLVEAVVAVLFCFYCFQHRSLFTIYFTIWTLYVVSEC